jgi:regulator of protease activity HflC (stomatin/prohibitin superfamily)
MSIGTILGFISLAGWALVIAGAAIAISNAAQNRSGRPGILLSVIGLVVGVIFFIFSQGVVEVGPNEVAVVFQRIGGDPKTQSLWPEPLGPGFHIIMPIVNEATIYSTRSLNYTMVGKVGEGAVSGNDAVEARTKDGQEVFVDATVLFSIDPTKVNIVHLKWQNRFESELVRATVRAAIREVISGYAAEDVYGAKRGDIPTAVVARIGTQFAENGLQLNQMLIRNVTFSEVFVKAIEQKQVSQQQAEQAKLEADRKRTLAKGEADAAVTAAQGEADANVARAKGEAQAIELRAGADAKALALINEQISKNPLLVQWRYIEKLAGNISLVLLPSNSPFLFDIQSLLNMANTRSAGSNGGSGTSQPQPTVTPQPTTP